MIGCNYKKQGLVTPDEMVSDVVRRAVDIVQMDAMKIGISPLKQYEVDLVIAGAEATLTALAEMSRESS